MEAKSHYVHFWRSIDILLGNIFSRHGIEANLEKIAAMTNMKPPAYVKDV